MINCELYSVQGNDSDSAILSEKFDSVASMLYEKDIRVIYKTDIERDQKKIAKALLEIQHSDAAPDCFIFANALSSKDSSSFKRLFYEFVTENERAITPDEQHKDTVPKIKICSLGDLGNGYRGYCFKIFDKSYIILPQATLAGIDVQELIGTAVSKADEIFTNNEADFPDGLVFIDKSAKKKEGFFKSLLPKKTDPRNTKIRKWVVLAAIFVFLCAAAYLINDLIIQPYLNSRINSEIQEIAYQTHNNSDDDDNSPSQDWAALKKINKEIVGWISIDKTNIDYPVLEHKGDDAYSQYYLNHTYKKDYSVYGSIFMDYRSTDSVNSKNVILHGHHMNDGSMFSSLLDYGALSGNLKYYKTHPVIEFNTPEGDAKWKIISVFKTSTLYEHGEFFNYMQGEFGSDAEFMNFVYNVRIRSLFNIPVMVNEDDQILTLSTCSYEFTNWRTVVVARKVRNGESADVDTEIATKNSSPVFPDVYYRSNGGKRPTVSTFKNADKKGLINWYDGKGNLKGDETLTATVAANPTEAPTTKKGNTSSIPKDITFYTVTFMNYDGSEFVSKSVEEGHSVSLPNTNPTMPDDDYYTYTFKGWQTSGLDLKNVKYSMNIAPDFEARAK